LDKNKYQYIHFLQSKPEKNLYCYMIFYHMNFEYHSDVYRSVIQIFNIIKEIMFHSFAHQYLTFIKADNTCYFANGQRKLQKHFHLLNSVKLSRAVITSTHETQFMKGSNIIYHHSETGAQD
ncbi:hypothetical protein ACJX0J_040699, partial [Zea mays]